MPFVIDNPVRANDKSRPIIRIFYLKKGEPPRCLDIRRRPELSQTVVVAANSAFLAVLMMMTSRSMVTV
jgi:hypothetical protein